eukprot:TRINITY_DN24851_c0_g1_i1.p1 TRINITY_DN24851_c0_g1~~TRINITY_DN24851_c0_g1_i1.p1  ORF type:complete len:695 (+),score=178.29 TRINITY_DN24851_c0_g1_i1:101-2086(+)
MAAKKAGGFLGYFLSSRKKKGKEPVAAAPASVRTRKIEMFANRWMEVQRYFEGQDVEPHDASQIRLIANKIDELAKLLAFEEIEVVGQADEAPPCVEFVLKYDVVNTLCCLATKSSRMPTPVRCALVLCVADIVLFSGGVRDRPLVGHFVQVVRPVASLIAFMSLTDGELDHDPLVRYVTLYLVYAIAYQLTAFPSCAEFFFDVEGAAVEGAFPLLSYAMKFFPTFAHPAAAPSRDPYVLSEAVHHGRGVVLGKRLHHADLALDILRCLAGVWYDKVAGELGDAGAALAAGLGGQLAWLAGEYRSAGADVPRAPLVERLEKLLATMDWVVENGASSGLAKAVLDVYTETLTVLFKGDGDLVLVALPLLASGGDMLLATYTAGVRAATALSAQLSASPQFAAGAADWRRVEFALRLLCALVAAVPRGAVAPAQRAAAEHAIATLPNDVDHLFNRHVQWGAAEAGRRNTAARRDAAAGLAALALPGEGEPTTEQAVLSDPVLELAGGVLRHAAVAPSRVLVACMHLVSQALLCEGLYLTRHLGALPAVLFGTDTPVARGLEHVAAQVDQYLRVSEPEDFIANLHAARANLGIQPPRPGGASGGGPMFEAWCILEEWRVELNACLRAVADNAALQSIGLGVGASFATPSSFGFHTPTVGTPVPR